MIKSIFIKNFTLIDKLHLNFDKRLNVITGETGSGKSIIIGAVDIVLGERASKEVIKTGEEKAFIEMVLEVNDKNILNFIKNNDIDLEFDNEIIISREITQNATKTRINGVLVTQSFMQELRHMLIDIHSQHQTYKYLNPKTHIHLLDNYGDSGHQQLIADYKEKYSQLLKLRNDYKNKTENLEATRSQIDFLKFQIEEIENAKITDINEYDELKKQREVIVNTESLKEVSYGGYYALYDSENSIISLLDSIERNLTKASNLDERLAPLAENIANSSISLKETADELRSYSENLETNAQLLEEIEERINLLDKLRRKYGSTLEQILENYEKYKSQLDEIEISDEKILELEKHIKQTEEETDKLAQKISENRQTLAMHLSKLVKQEIHSLEMPRADFKIEVNKTEKNQNGADEVEFLIITNPGEPFKPLSKIASGGEISRIMLALKSIFAKSDKINTVIFDEIDTGISGKASQAVAEELVKLSSDHQILCITHQPIIAAMGHKHFYVQKIQEENTTTVEVSTLSEEGRVKTLSWLAGGNLSEDSKNFAQKLLEQAREFKEQYN